MAWQTIRVANPYRRRPARRNANVLTDLLAGDIAAKVSKSVMSSLTGTGRKRRKAKPKRKRKNPHLALIGGNPRKRRRYGTKEGLQFASPGTRTYDFMSYGSGTTKAARKSMERYKRKQRKKKKSSSGLKLNGGTMAKARRRKRNSVRNRARDSKGRLLKVRNKRTSSRRRNVARANPRRRRRNRVRVITKIKYRTRRINVAKRRKRKATRRRSRRRNTALAAVNPRRRRRSRRRRNVAAAVNPRRRRARVTRRRRRRNTGARRNAGFGGILGRLNIMQVAEVGIGAIAGDKLATWGGSKVASMVGVTDPMMTGLIKAGLGIVGAGFVSKFRPALALGLAVGAVNGLLNEYVFTPYISPYLPLSGGRGLGEYVDRTWKADNWLASGGAPGALAGMGNNSLNRNSL